MIDHVNFPVLELRASRAFYEPLMAVLGMQLLYEDDEVLGFGSQHWVFGLIVQEAPISPLHLAFKVSDEQRVRAFHAEGLRRGGQSNGDPGLRPEYGQQYYAAYLKDPDGHNIEAVCRGSMAAETCV